MLLEEFVEACIGNPDIKRIEIFKKSENLAEVAWRDAKGTIKKDDFPINSSVSSIEDPSKNDNR